MLDLYPIVVMQDRYSGAYAGGGWFAIAEASTLVDCVCTRAQFCLVGDDGPSDSDVEAAGFWRNRPDWIAVGRTPDEAAEALRANAAGQNLKYAGIIAISGTNEK